MSESVFEVHDFAGDVEHCVVDFVDVDSDDVGVELFNVEDLVFFILDGEQLNLDIHFAELMGVVDGLGSLAGVGDEGVVVGGKEEDSHRVLVRV